jgi:hypothetical protein
MEEPMSRGIYELCLCGHRHPEHSMFDVCHGCTDCEDVVVIDGVGMKVASAMGEAGDDHRYRQCECREFRTAPEQQIAS